MPDVTNESAVSPGLMAWHSRFAEALTARDTDAYVAFLADDCSVQINNAVPFYSKLAIRSAYDAYLQIFSALTVEVLAIHGTERSFSVEALLSYACHDGKTEVVQCAYFINRREDGLIASVRVYGNASRVFRPFIRARQ